MINREKIQFLFWNVCIVMQSYLSYIEIGKANRGNEANKVLLLE